MAATQIYRKSMVCLANSKKYGGACIAGREFDGSSWGPWVRPVSPRPSHEVMPSDLWWASPSRPATLSVPKLSEIMSVPLVEHAPVQYQTENHVIAGKGPLSGWRVEGSVDWEALLAGVEHPEGPLWANGSGWDYSSYNGRHDRVPVGQARELRRSLWLVRPENLVLSIGLEGAATQKRQVRADFQLCGEDYRLMVTDPVILSAMARRKDGSLKSTNDALLTISLGEEYNGYAYKLVAGVLWRGRLERE
jgi:hypothetical protein